MQGPMKSSVEDMVQKHGSEIDNSDAGPASIDKYIEKLTEHMSAGRCKTRLKR